MTGHGFSLFEGSDQPIFQEDHKSISFVMTKSQSHMVELCQVQPHRAARHFFFSGSLFFSFGLW
jgi:hypothetical protein